jgi:hypothetical protein
MKKNSLGLSRGASFLAQLAVGLAFLLLPFTSLPWLSKLMVGPSAPPGSVGPTVAPPSVIFIFAMTVTWLPIYLLRGGKLPGETRPFLVFVVVVLVASAAAFFLPIPPYKGYSLRGAEVRALITLAIGVATYFIITLWHRNNDHFKWALWLVNVSGVIILTWSFMQLYFILFTDSNYPIWIIRIQRLISTRDLLGTAFNGRVGGFTYEPSWLAHQLNVLFIPYWLAATLTGYSVTKKVLHLSVENILLVSGLVIWYFTLSRVGLLAFVLILAYLFYQLNINGLQRLQKRLHNHLQSGTAKNNRHIEPFIRALFILVLVLVYAGGFIGLLFLLPHINPRFGALLKWQAYATNLLEYAFRLGFAERVVYWAVGWATFARYPLLGVGLGNTGFFFAQLMPNLSQRLGEINTLVYFSQTLPNIKSFWLRLLAETGLVGFSIFVAWQVVLWRAGNFLRKNNSILMRTLGWMGTFAILAFLVEGFSIDSLTLPYLWVSMGLVTAASALARREAISRRDAI